MGCDIHIITQIKKGDKWEYIDDIPQSLNERNYTTFAVLAGVRDSFNSKVFQAKGLPFDIEDKKFRFKSDSERHKKTYNEDDGLCLKMGDDYIYRYANNDTIKKTYKTISQEEYNYIHRNIYDTLDDNVKKEFRKKYIDLCESSNKGNIQYSVLDASIVGGEWVWHPYNKIFASFEEFEKTLYEDDWNEDAQDYGHYDIDFECEDYHTPSYLTLKEFLDADYSNYLSRKCKIPKVFINAFQKAGGVFPDDFKLEESSVSSISDAFSEAVEPTFTVVWKDDTDNIDKSKYPLFKGIDELKEIAEKYEVKNPENIRIVFCFDN